MLDQLRMSSPPPLHERVRQYNDEYAAKFGGYSQARRLLRKLNQTIAELDGIGYEAGVVLVTHAPARTVKVYGSSRLTHTLAAHAATDAFSSWFAGITSVTQKPTVILV